MRRPVGNRAGNSEARPPGRTEAATTAPPDRSPRNADPLGAEAGGAPADPLFPGLEDLSAAPSVERLLKGAFANAGDGGTGLFCLTGTRAGGAALPCWGKLAAPPSASDPEVAPRKGLGTGPAITVWLMRIAARGTRTGTAG